MFFGFASLWSIWSDLKASRSSSSSSDDPSSSTGSLQLSWLRTSLLKGDCERVFLLLPYGTNFLKDFSILRKSHSKLLFRFWKALNYLFKLNKKFRALFIKAVRSRRSGKLMDLRNILEEFLMDSNCAFYKKVVVVGEGHCVAIFSCLILTLFTFEIVSGN